MKKYGFTLSEWIEQSERSKNYESYKLYILEVYDDNERFIKIGRTFTSVYQRYSGVEVFPYKYILLKEIIGTPFHIFNLETKIKRLCKPEKYIPIKTFKGFNECFKLDCLTLIDKYLNDNT